MPNFFQRFFNFRKKSETKVTPEGEQMIENQQRIQRAAESILENEALTADLEDEAAKILLDWGVAQAKSIASQTTGMDEAQAEEAMYQPMRALRKMLRSANKWIIDPQERNLGRTMKQAEIVYGSIPDDEQQVEFLTRIPGRAVDRAKALQSFIQETHRDLFDT